MADAMEASSSSGAPALHQERVGYASRFRVGEGDLPPGWRRERRGHKYTVWHDDRGNRYKSSVEVERVLRERGLLCDDSEDGTETETGGETSEYEPSPVKKPRTPDV